MAKTPGISVQLIEGARHTFPTQYKVLRYVTGNLRAELIIEKAHKAEALRDKKYKIDNQACLSSAGFNFQAVATQIFNVVPAALSENTGLEKLIGEVTEFNDLLRREQPEKPAWQQNVAEGVQRISSLINSAGIIANAGPGG